MDYLELDDAATQAFEELGGDSTSAHIPSRPSKSMYTSTTSRTRPRPNALGLPRVPQLESGVGEDSESGFCRLSQSSINALDAWVEKHCPNQKFINIRIGLAHKDTGVLPLLGWDPTLPHHRPDLPVVGIPDGEEGSEYPVRYFFYDGRVRVCAGRYKALVDEPGAVMGGLAFSCESVDQEEALRAYEGDSYEVVAARLVVDGREVVGRTFRFAGCEEELSE
ncbi:hypothetical protein BKA58DRAFT_404983 [Alternaria rosae]|uniref:uncharacterized protein n=1 Tax=Alternaria rosae TaxID=1187941 RepID=UPI001E8CA44D|nr:uncharacterized protein BKA58DRAFT_404983 [Alternaria rosae]KAH6865221.1 hypothetical protein BKA58DRAFT_404983 [Alternaria rosae]